MRPLCQWYAQSGIIDKNIGGEMAELGGEGHR
jgi:hypothetical protein